MQIYDMQIDQTSQKPSLDVTFAVRTTAMLWKRFKDTPANSEQFFYGQRVVLLGRIPLKTYDSGKILPGNKGAWTLLPIVPLPHPRISRSWNRRRRNSG